MGRRSNFGSVVNRSLKAMAREADRAARAAAREQKARMREYERQEKLNNKINKMEAACSFTGKLTTLNLDFLSLKKDSSFLIKMQSLNSIYSDIEKDTLIEVINYLKLGNRNDAITCLKDETNLDYNKIICFVASIENNLYRLLKENEDCWFEDKFGEYEFLPINELFEIDSDVDYETAKSEVEISCQAINEKELISGKDPSVVKNKINKAIEKLNKKWQQQFNKYHLERENKIIETIKSEQVSLLKYIVSNEIEAFDYDSLKDKSLFVSKLPKVKKPKLTLNDLSDLSNKLLVLEDSKPTDEKTEFLFWEKWLCYLFMQDKMETRRKQRYIQNLKNWENDKQILSDEIETVKNKNKETKNKYNADKETYDKYLNDVAKEKEDFQIKQNEYNRKIDERIEKFHQKDIFELQEYFKNSLMLSTYPIIWEKEIDLSYNENNKTIVIDYKLPLFEEIYNIEKINYAVSKNEFSVIQIKEKQLKQIYNSILYQICLRTVYEIFSLDIELNCVDSVTFNGIITATDKATGNNKTACILSLMATDENLADIDFGNVEPRECFKSLKGIGASELSSVTAIMPIRNIDKDDKRFIDAYEILDTVNSGTNLAAIKWQDFENLIREVFEKEFSKNGGEVKITQASKDGGVDAVAFDPDPIRGGKIVIQAKRYTNIVGVSAVRDLYGTVMNEGANSGILVTTSDYGADAYEFAKGKPINLLNGSELLGLMQKHGYEAYINLKEAKNLLNE